MRVRRDIASVPVRSAKETWAAIIDLVTGPDTVDRHQLEAAASILESIIADEVPASVPIVFMGAGPRVLIYCLYNEDAMEAGRSVDSLPANPTAGNWQATAPAEAEDVAWMNKSLTTRALRISVHDREDAPEDSAVADAEQSAKSIQIDWGALTKP